MTVIFKIEKEEEGFSAKAVDLPIFTQGDTMDELSANIKDALNCYFEKTFIGTVDMVLREAVG